MTQLTITETPRDAMQGILPFIDTSLKIKYLNQVLKVGFQIVDFGSFVSPRAIPQMSDVDKVIDNLDLSNTSSKIMATIANLKGAERACNYQQIDYLGFPYSMSTTFLKLNINSDMVKTMETVEGIINLCVKHNKTLVLYNSMAFGNPYGDLWTPDMVYHCTNELKKRGVNIIIQSDTTGTATAQNIRETMEISINNFPEINWGVHLHADENNRLENLEAAYYSGCRWFDAVLNGKGGCPMSKQRMVGNLQTGFLIDYLGSKGEKMSFDMIEFKKAQLLALEIFPLD